MSVNITHVNIDLAKFAKAIGVGLGIAVDKIGRELHTGIVRKTPVDTGRARASWDATIGAPSTKTAGGGYSIQPDGKEEVFIVSNLDYIEALENGHSQQAPQGMVTISVAEIEADIDGILQGLADEAESAA